jgi:hypothetical protein
MTRLLKATIDVTKIKKEHLYEGKKGTYLSLDIWINEEEDKYGNIAGIKQSYKINDEYESHFIGNAKEHKKREDLF